LKKMPLNIRIHLTGYSGRLPSPPPGDPGRYAAFSAKRYSMQGGRNRASGPENRGSIEQDQTEVSIDYFQGCA